MGDQMPSLPMTCGGEVGGEEVEGEEGEGEERQRTKSRVPFVGEASMEAR